MGNPTKKQRLAALEREVAALKNALGTLIAWLPQPLGEPAQKDLLERLNGGPAPRKRKKK